MKLKNKLDRKGKLEKANGKEFSSLEEVVGHFFPEEDRKKKPTKGKELGTYLAEEVFDNLLKKMP
jgi:hypothetical protein